MGIDHRRFRTKEEKETSRPEVPGEFRVDQVPHKETFDLV